MPIITPASPAQNSSYNVMVTTWEIIIWEFEKAAKVVSRILNGSAPWSWLFKKLDYFKAYP